MTIRRVDERYTLEREIGRGGSGPVWLGDDELLGRRVAIKRIGLPPGAVDADAMRAEREARLAAAVNHPHVVAVFDLVSTGDDHWLVMEYVEGTTLADRVRQDGALSPDAAAPLLLQAADALAAAHAAGIVHRDVKPSNMLIDHHGTVKLSDFGIARAVADASLTQTGLVTGSPAYLSPEVASGAMATTASDVWSFGASLFHALAGTPPYDVGDNLMGALYRIVNEPPPRLPAAGWLSPLVEATMSKDPADRPGMVHVAEYLRARVESTGGGTAATSGVGPASRTSVVISGAASGENAADRPTETSTEAPTEQLPAVGTPTPPPPPPPASPLPLAPDGGYDEHRRPDDSARRTPVVLGVVAVVLLALLGAALLLTTGGDDSPTADGPRDVSESATQASPDEPTTGETSAPPTEPTEQELVDFARDYVRVASSDPDAGFDYLTPAYQRSSPRYRDFWGSVSDARITEISADPDSMSVTYSYRYRLDGSRRRGETVTLNVVQDGDRLLIASATAG